MIVGYFVKFSYFYYSTSVYRVKYFFLNCVKFGVAEDLFPQEFIGLTSVLTNEFYPSKQLPSGSIHVITFMVPEVGFEPTHPEGNSFTDCRASPPAPLWLMVTLAGFEPAIQE